MNAHNRKSPIPAAYQSLEQIFARINGLEGATAMLSWDRSVMMPRGAGPVRAQQIATLDVLGHELLTDDRLADLLAEAEGEKTALDAWQMANLYEMNRRYRHAVALPPDLVEALALATSACEMQWRDCRENSDFKGLLPIWQEVLDLTRQAARAKGDALGLDPYDALLDSYDPGMRAARVDEVFTDLAAVLPSLIDEAIEWQSRQPTATEPTGPFDIDRQKELGRRLSVAAGFDFDRGRLDVSTHPFCGGVPGDIRLTTRYCTSRFVQAMMGVLHETGHALYEMGLPDQWLQQPVGNARGMTLHESQSLCIEMQAGRSRKFMEFFAPLAAEILGGTGPAWQPMNIWRVATKVQRSFIRVEADEVTYPAHVIARYRLERAMIGGDLALADLPGAWNEQMMQLLNIVPPDHRHGCLQDIHWPDGAFGYFPTYSLGAMTAAQFFEAAKLSDPTIPDCLSKGDFQPLLSWLRTNVHHHASSLDTETVIEKATGQRLSAAAFKRHIKRRYCGA